MDSQKWLEYARYKPFPLIDWILARRHEARTCGEAAGGKFDFCTAITRGEWETLERIGLGFRQTGSRTAWTASYFVPPAESAYEPDTICFVGRMDYYPNQECMSDFCARVLPELRLGARAQALHRGRRSFAAVRQAR